MITDVILNRLPEGRYKDYFKAHKEEYIDWAYDHEDYPLWMFFPAELNNIDDAQSKIVKKLRLVGDEFDKVWKAAAERFPDEKLREYFKDRDNFSENFYWCLLHYFHDEEIRYEILFDVCPKLKSIASDTSNEMINKIYEWAESVDFF